MTADDMWDYAKQKGYDKDTTVHGKTPWRTIQAQMYVSIQKDPKSPFVKVSPRVFGLRSITYSSPSTYNDKKDKQKTTNKVVERDLHPLLVSFVKYNDHFNGDTKTIHHENSKKGSKNEEKWMHPDLVSVRLPFEDLDSESIKLATNAGIDTIRIFSFELKRDINIGNVREYYFQAVSNSSWANEGYLVSPKCSESALEQLARLNASFGIGFIKLNIEDVFQSEILLPSRDNDLDIGMINDLSEINEDFAKFIKAINDSMKIGYFVGKNFDKVLDGDELKEYIDKKNFNEI